MFGVPTLTSISTAGISLFLLFFFFRYIGCFLLSCLSYHLRALISYPIFLFCSLSLNLSGNLVSSAVLLSLLFVLKLSLFLSPQSNLKSFSALWFLKSPSMLFVLSLHCCLLYSTFPLCQIFFFVS